TGAIYAAQTFTNMPDNRRVQIGWGRITHPDMPFNGMMLLPTELSLQNTKNGPRLFSIPVEETQQLFNSMGKWKALSSDKANKILDTYRDKEGLRIKTTFKLSHATSAGLSLFGQHLIDYDLNANKVNDVFYSPNDMTSMEITADIYIDKTSVEVFIDEGAYSYSMEKKFSPDNKDGFHFWGNNIEIKNLEVFEAKIIWF